jgi:hypothetical protein
MHTITATLTKDRNGKPIAVIDGLPGGGAEFSAREAGDLALIMADVAGVLNHEMEGRRECKIGEE